MLFSLLFNFSIVHYNYLKINKPPAFTPGGCLYFSPDFAGECLYVRQFLASVAQSESRPIAIGNH